MSEREATVSAASGTGERLIWSGRPGRPPLVSTWDLLFWPLWLIAAAAVFYEVMRPGGMRIRTAAAVAVLAAGPAYIGAKAVLTTLHVARTSYALTDRRIVILSGALTQRPKEVLLESVRSVELEPERHGRGTIRFITSPTREMDLLEPAWRLACPSFDSVDDAESVYVRAREALEKARAERGGASAEAGA